MTVGAPPGLVPPPPLTVSWPEPWSLLALPLPEGSWRDWFPREPLPPSPLPRRPRFRMRRDAIVLLTGLLWALGAGAQTPPEEAAPPADNEMAGEASIYARPRTPPRLEAREGRLVRPGDRVDANDVLDEIIDEFAADVARLGANRISPILLERVRVSENMNPEFASVFEARLIAAIYRAANVRVVRCYECYATHAEVENGTWVVRRGLSRREDLQQVMKKYNAQVVLNASLTLYTAPNSFAFDVEMVRGEDASVFFAEGYRVHPHTALLYRSADKVQHREARLKDLEDRINAKPRFNHSVHLGAIVIPTQNHPDGAIWAPYTAYRFTEAFGEERTGARAGRWRPSSTPRASEPRCWRPRCSRASTRRTSTASTASRAARRASSSRGRRATRPCSTPRRSACWRTASPSRRASGSWCPSRAVRTVRIWWAG
ncbi:hypothetical protein ACN28S_50835 [Cystobacter fuscus]